MMDAAKKIKLKCRYDNEIRVVMLSTDALFVQLRKRLSADYNFEVSLKYEDTEGDMITLSSQNDLDDLLQGAMSVVNVVVAEALPILHGRRSAQPSRVGGATILGSGHHMDTGQPQRTSMRMQSPMSMTSGGRAGRDPSLFPSVPQQGYPSRSIRWKKAEIIGKGAFGVVFLGLDADTGGLMAVKQMAIDEVSARELSNLENEINLLKTLEHPNIVRYLGTEVTAQYLTIFLEYVPGGSVRALIEKFGALEEPVARSYTRQMLLGLEYLHRSGIAHRDIKGANCLVGNDGVIKLADFGASKHWRSPVTTTVVVQTDVDAISRDRAGRERQSDIRGTPQWMAPEVVRGDESGTGGVNWKKADIWSLGCTAIEMTTGRPPWCHLTNPVTVLYHIACSATLPTFPDPASVELITFLNLCLQRDPVNRPEVTSLLLHSFVANVAMGPSASYNYNMTRPTTVSTMPSGNWMSNDSSGFGAGLNDERSRIERSTARNMDRRSEAVSSLGKGARPTSSKALHPADLGTFLSAKELSSSLSFGKDIGLLPAGDASMDLDMSSSTIDMFDPHRDTSVVHDTGIPAPQHYPPLDSFARDESTDEFDDVSLRSGIRSLEESSLEVSLRGQEKKSDREVFETLSQALHLSPNIDSDMDADSIDLELSALNLNLNRVQKAVSPRGSPRLDPLVEKPSTDLRLLNKKQQNRLPLRSRADTDPTNISSESDMMISEWQQATDIKPSSKAPPVAAPKGMDSPLSRPAKSGNATNNRPLSIAIGPDAEKKLLASPKRRNSKILPASPGGTKSGASVLVKVTDQSMRPVGSASTSGLVGIILDQRRGLNNAMNSPNDTTAGAVLESDEEVVDEDEKVYAYREDADSSSSYSPARKFAGMSSVPKLNSRENNRSTQKIFSTEDADEVPEEGPLSLSHKRLNSSGDVDIGRDGDAQELSSDEEEAHRDALFACPPAGQRSGIQQNRVDVYMPAEMPSSSNFSPNERNRLRTLNKEEEAFYQNQQSRAMTSVPEKSTRSQHNSNASLSTTSSQPNLILVAGSGVSKKADLLPGVVKQRSNKSSRPPPGNSVSRGFGSQENVDLESSIDSLRVSGAATAKGASRHLSTAQAKNSLSDASSTLPAAFGTKNTSKEKDATASIPDYSSLQIHGSDFAMREIIDSSRDLLCESLTNAIAEGKCQPTVLSEHRGAITRMRILPRLNLLLSSSTDGTVRIWGGAVDDVSSKLVLDTGDFKVAAANPSSAKRPSALSDSEGGIVVKPRVMSTWADSSAEIVWGACSDGAVRLWQGGNEAVGGKALRLFKGHEDSVTVLEGAEGSGSDNGLVASGSSDRTVRVWDQRLKRPQAFQFRGHSDAILSVRWANGGRELISSSKDKTVKVWDLRSGRLKSSLERHFGAVTAIKVVPVSVAQQADALAFVSAGRDSMLHGWSASGDCMGSQAAHRGPIACISDIRSSLSFGPASSSGAPVMLSSGADGLTKLWDLRRMKVISEIGGVTATGAASNTVSKIVWIGESFVTATASGSVLLWNHKSVMDNSFGSLSDSLINRSDWVSHSLGEHSFSCTDLQASDNLLVCSSKAGVIFRWQ